MMEERRRWWLDSQSGIGMALHPPHRNGGVKGREYLLVRPLSLWGPAQNQHIHAMYTKQIERPQNVHELCDHDNNIPLRPQHKPHPHEQLPTPHPLLTIPLPLRPKTYLTKGKMGIGSTIHCAAVSTKRVRDGSP